jgi:hypothetical protein
MRFVSVVMAVAILCGAGPLRAAVTLVYSFEDSLAAGPDGFFGLGATVTQDMIGATHSTHSMKYAIGVGGFVGARTETDIPAALNDPPGVTHILFDLTLTADYTDTLANLGVTVFGHALNKPGGAEFGHQVQFADVVDLAGLAPGTHTDLQIDLDLSVGPYRAGESFDAIFGPGPNDLTVASAFQFFISKNVLTPLTVYIDNVRLVGDDIILDVDGNGVVEPLTDLLLGLRYSFGFRGNALITGVVGSGCTRCDAPSIEAYLATLVN